MNNKFKYQAIYNLYSLVKIINETKEGVITAKDQDGNEVSIDMTAVNTKATELENAEVDLKASAKAKLIAGEALTAAEADTIVL